MSRVILNLGDKGKAIDVSYDNTEIRLLNKLTEWRAHWSLDEDGNRVKNPSGETSYTDPASGYGIHIAAALGDADDGDFQRGHKAKKIEIGDEEDGPHAEIVKLVEMAYQDAPGLDIGHVDLSDPENAVIEVLVTGKNGSVDTLKLNGQLALHLSAKVPGLALDVLSTAGPLEFVDLSGFGDAVRELINSEEFAEATVGATSFNPGVADQSNRGDDLFTGPTGDNGTYAGGKGDDIFIGTSAKDTFHFDSRDGAADGTSGEDKSLHVKTIIGFGGDDVLSFRLDGAGNFNGVAGFDYNINRDDFGVDDISELGAMLNQLEGENAAFYDAGTNSTVLIIDDSVNGSTNDEIAIVLYEAGNLL